MLHRVFFNYFVLIACIHTSTIIRAQLPNLDEIQDWKPDHAGLYHTDAFHQLAQSLHGRSSTDDFMQTVIQIAVGYCNSDECKFRADLITRREFQRSRHKVDDSKDDHPVMSEIRQMLRRNSQNGRLLESDAIGELLSLRQNLIESHENNTMGLSLVSVAIESTRLWSDVYTNKFHPLHGFVNKKQSNRRMQFDIFGVIDADVTALQENFSNGIIEAIQASFSASAAAFLGDSGNEAGGNITLDALLPILDFFSNLSNSTNGTNMDELGLLETKVSDEPTVTPPSTSPIQTALTTLSAIPTSVLVIESNSSEVDETPSSASLIASTSSAYSFFSFSHNLPIVVLCLGVYMVS